VPVGNQQSQELVLLRRTSKTEFSEERFGSCRFVPLLGRFGWKE
jgi:protein-L-isoaspartate(D-aspartate) O-methyltransferase